MRVLDFPRTGVGTVGVRDPGAGDTTRAEARGSVELPFGYVALDVTAGVDPQVATSQLREGDLQWLRVRTMPDPEMAFLSRFTAVDDLTLATNAADATARTVGNLPTLTRLTLVGAELTSDALTALTGLSSLLSLNISSPHVTNEAVIALLDALPNLRRIQIDAHRGVDDGLLEELGARGPRELKYIGFRYCPFVSAEAVKTLRDELGEGYWVGLATDRFGPLNPGLFAQEAPWALELDDRP